MKLLFVEDDIEIRNNLLPYLKTVFDYVFEASDGLCALEKYIEVNPDVILLDINIPKLNGIEFATEIRKKDQKTAIIILTAHDDKDILLKAIELKLTKYLLKPISRYLLKEALNKAISNLNDINYVNLIDEFKWNKKDKILIHNNKSLNLTKNEIIFLDNYCNNSCYLFSNEDIHNLLYSNEDYNENKIRMFLKRFRKNTSQNLLINVYSQGYKFNYINISK